VWGVGDLNYRLLDYHYVCKVVAIFTIDLDALEVRILDHSHKVVQLVEVLLKIRSVVPHPQIN
jgi:hypothetical protein